MLDAVNSSDARRILLDKYLRGELASTPSPRRLQHMQGGTLASLSQEQVWLHTLENATIPQMYTESITIYRTGSLDLSALKRSLREILRRHEIWRTTFEMTQGQLRQVIGQVTEFPLTVVDLRDWRPAERDGEAIRMASNQAQQPFDLQRGPLVRALLVMLGDREYHLYFDMHQIVTDGISVFQVLPTELAALYESFVSGRSAALPELPQQFADYAAWQRTWLQGPALQSQLDYWRNLFATEVPALDWPNDLVRAPVETHRGKIEPFTISREILNALQSVRRAAGASLFAGLVAAFGILLHCYTQEEEIVLGTFAPCGRHQTEFQKLLGYFMNPVPLRLQVSGAGTFREFMLQAQEVIAGAISHGDVPFDQVITALDLRPLPGRHPLFQFAISLAPALSPLPTGWDMTPMDVESGGARWDLYLEMSERREHLLGRAQYNPDLFHRTTVVALLDDFCRLVKTVGAAPDQHLSDLLIEANAARPENLR